MSYMYDPDTDARASALRTKLFGSPGADGNVYGEGPARSRRRQVRHDRGVSDPGRLSAESGVASMDTSAEPRTSWKTLLQQSRNQELADAIQTSLELTGPRANGSEGSRPHSPTHDSDSGISHSLSMSSLKTKSPVIARALSLLGETYDRRKEELGRPVHRSPSWSKPHSYSTNRPQNSIYRAQSHESLHRPQDSLFRSPSPSRQQSQDSSFYATPSGMSPEKVLQDSLQESESRRLNLVDKLREAQETLQLQTERLTEAEGKLSENKMTVANMKSHQQQLEFRVNTLEKDKADLEATQIEGIQRRDELHDRIGQLDAELHGLQASYSTLQAEYRQRQALVDQTSTALNMMEQENNNFQKTKDTMGREITALKESLQLAKLRSDKLEAEKQVSQQEANNLREKQQALITQNSEVTQKLAEVTTSYAHLKDDWTNIGDEFSRVKQERDSLFTRTTRLEDVLADAKSKLASVTAEKDRLFQEKIDLHQKVQKMTVDKEQLMKAKHSVEEQCTELHVDLAQAKLSADKNSQEKLRVEQELNAVKKVSEDLSSELSMVKHNLEKAQELNKQLESSKRLATQQQLMLEGELKRVTQDKDLLNKSFERLKKEQEGDRERWDEQQRNLRETLQELRDNKQQLDTRTRELEKKLSLANEEHQYTMGQIQAECAEWRDTCERLTGMLERKEDEARNLQQKLQDIQEKNSALRMEQQLRTMKEAELTEAQQEIDRLGEEKQRLQQENAENQQVIRLLEMQKNILTKPQPGSEPYEQLQAEVDRMKAELTLNQDKLEELQRDRTQLIQQIEELMAEKDSSLSMDRTKMSEILINHPTIRTAELDERCQALERERLNLQGVNDDIKHQLTKLEKENEVLRQRLSAADSPSGTDTNPALLQLQRENERFQEDYRRLKASYNELENRHLRLISSPESPGDRSDDSKQMKKEITRLESQVSLQRGQIVLLENSKRRLEDQNKKLEAKVQELEEREYNDSFPGKSMQEGSSQRTTSRSSGDGSSGGADQEKTVLMEKLKGEKEKFRREVESLSSQLKDAEIIQEKQENVIKRMKEELEDEKMRKPKKIRFLDELQPPQESMDEVGAELLHVRGELQKVWDMIHVKDGEIEEHSRQLEEARAKHAEVQLEKDRLQQKVDSLQRQVLSKEETITELRNEKNNIQGQRRGSGTLAEKLECLEIENQTLKDKCHDLGMTIAELEVANKDLSRKFEDLSKDKASADQEISSLRSSIAEGSSTDDERRRLGVECTRLTDELDISSLELEEKTKQVSSLEKRLQNSQEQLQRVKEEKRGLEAKVENLQTENDELEEKLRRVLTQRILGDSSKKEPSSEDTGPPHTSTAPISPKKTDVQNGVPHGRTSASTPDWRKIFGRPEAVGRSQTGQSSPEGSREGGPGSPEGGRRSLPRTPGEEEEKSPRSPRRSSGIPRLATLINGAKPTPRHTGMLRSRSTEVLKPKQSSQIPSTSKSAGAGLSRYPSTPILAAHAKSRLPVRRPGSTSRSMSPERK
ncbi:cingulin-like isoform X1 [Branchiostoma lanceolatum]|uniref:cingulin-like isoform X1 n=2 Tax=Branchiostoma lanceolatum TaxID=7740 RepID=UPI0034512A02